MLTSRDIATLSWYGVLFSAIVLWANWRTAGDSRGLSPQAPRVLFDAGPPDHLEEQQEMRRIMQRMVR
jgi:hypothetical protein